MRRIIIAVVFTITCLTQATAQKAKVKQDSIQAPHELVLMMNEEQLIKLNTAMQVAGQSELLNNSNQFTTLQRNQMFGFMDSLAGVVYRQMLIWHPAPPPPKKQDSVTKKP